MFSLKGSDKMAIFSDPFSCNFTIIWDTPFTPKNLEPNNFDINLFNVDFEQFGQKAANKLFSCNSKSIFEKINPMFLIDKLKKEL